MKSWITLVGCCLVACSLFGQVNTVPIRLDWDTEPTSLELLPGQKTEVLTFAGSQWHSDYPGLPVYSYQLDLPGPSRLEAVLQEVRSDGPATLTVFSDQDVPADFQIRTDVSVSRGRFIGTVQVIPLRRLGVGKTERLLEAQLQVEVQPEAPVQVGYRGPEDVTQSRLAEGVLYKIRVREDGMYKLSYGFLKDQLGIDIDNIDPRNIQLLGLGGGYLPWAVSAFRYDDIEENAIFIQGEADGSFDNGDYLLFYGQGADAWGFDESRGIYEMQQNPFSEANYYFLKIGSTPGKRLSTLPNLQGQVSDPYTVDRFLDYRRLEEEENNVLYDYGSTEGSGQKWLGDGFRVTRERTYNEFSFPGLLPDEPVNLRVRFCGRSSIGSQLQVDVAGQGVTQSVPGTNINNAVTAFYCREVTLEEDFITDQQTLPVTVRYPETGASSEGWLDFIQINARRALRWTGNALKFQEPRAADFPFARYTLTNATGGLVVWEVTDPLHPSLQAAQINGNSLQFVAPADTLREYIVFDPNAGLLQPEVPSGAQVPNQNLHGLDDIDMLVVYHRDFKPEVDRLVAHRAAFNDFNVAAVEIEEVYNEFSSGKQDPTAIRDLATMLYRRTDRFKYLLLFGDGSFDYRNLLDYGPGERHHFIPTFETVESYYPLDAYPSDDYYGLLDNGEGGNIATGKMDIAIGRLPAKTLSEARLLVDKIISYETDATFLRDWRNRLVFVGDDEDGDLHARSANIAARIVENNYPVFNIDKIYFDAYQEVSTSGGDRYPDANQAINNNMFKGTLILNYMGHGGPTGWAQERVLTLEDIAGWNNSGQFPLLITATCSFTGFDEPNFVSGGERSILNDQGGCVALMTTVRAVFASDNLNLVRRIFNTIFERENGRVRTIGETTRLATNSSSDTENSRKFALIGDPAMQLAVPRYQVVTTEVNGQPVIDNNTVIDTFRALSKVTVKGRVADQSGQFLSDFNGRVYVTLFDKVDTLTTLGQKSTPYTFELRKNILFRGAATVSNGQFSITFIVPKDIDYDFGKGKLSYYAENGITDGAGFFEGIFVGGTDPEGLNDDQGPLVEVFMNSEDFVSGGLTNEDPVLLVKLRDDNGINVSRSSVGHDMTAVLNEDFGNIFLLNDFYEAELDDYTRGTVRFPLYDLEEGRYTVRVKAWDVANNSAEGVTEFIVADDEDIALDRVLNYPNPFTTNTWFEFEHNYPGRPLEVQVSVYTISGKLVKTLYRDVFSEGARVTRDHGLQWDGLDDYGGQLARGVYLYKVRVRATGLDGSEKTAESDFEKLVILK